MSYQKQRDIFIARCGLSVDTARALLRHATTLQRLAEAQCNGDWPADNGQREVIPCPLCDRHWVPSQIMGGAAAIMAWKQSDQTNMRRIAHRSHACPDCRTEARVHALLDGTQWQAWTQGDPRGYVLRLFPRTYCQACHNRPGCQSASHKPMPVTHDDMYSGRVDSLGVPTH